MLDTVLLNTLSQAFSSAVQKIKIPSLDSSKEFSFREPTTKEVETISKVILSNSDSQSTVYASTLVFIKYLCMDDIDVYSMSEIDRLKVLTYILSGIFFSKNLTIHCPRVGCNNSFPYALKYGDILKKLDEIANVTFSFENHTSIGNVKLVGGFPTTRRYLNFLEFADGVTNKPIDYENFNNSFVEIDSTKENKPSTISSDDSFVDKIKKRREILKNKISKTVKDGNAIAGNIDFKSITDTKKLEPSISFIYIKKMLILNIPNSEDEYNIEFNELSYEDSTEIFNRLPMRLFVTEHGKNFIDFFASKVIESLNSCTPEIKCPTCGHDIAKGLGIERFFIYG